MSQIDIFTIRSVFISVPEKKAIGKNPIVNLINIYSKNEYTHK